MQQQHSNNDDALPRRMTAMEPHPTPSYELQADPLASSSHKPLTDNDINRDSRSSSVPPLSGSGGGGRIKPSPIDTVAAAAGAHTRTTPSLIANAAKKRWSPWQQQQHTTSQDSSGLKRPTSPHVTVTSARHSQHERMASAPTSGPLFTDSKVLSRPDSARPYTGGISPPLPSPHKQSSVSRAAKRLAGALAGHSDHQEGERDGSVLVDEDDEAYKGHAHPPRRHSSSIFANVFSSTGRRLSESMGRTSDADRTPHHISPLHSSVPFTYAEEPDEMDPSESFSSERSRSSNVHGIKPSASDPASLVQAHEVLAHSKKHAQAQATVQRVDSASGRRTPAAYRPSASSSTTQHKPAIHQPRASAASAMSLDMRGVAVSEDANSSSTTLIVPTVATPQARRGAINLRGGKLRRAKRRRVISTAASSRTFRQKVMGVVRAALFILAHPRLSIAHANSSLQSALQDADNAFRDPRTGARVYKPEWLDAWVPLLIWLVISLSSTALVLIFHTPVFRFLDGLANTLQSMGLSGRLIAGALIFLTTFPPLPLYSTLIILSGFAFGLWQGFIISYIAALSGAVTVFLLSRSLLRVWMVRLLNNSGGLKKVVRAIEKQPRLLFLVRLAPYPYNLMNTLLASSPTLTLKTYTTCTALALPKLLVHTGLGTSIKNFAAYHGAAGGPDGTAGGAAGEGMSEEDAAAAHTAERVKQIAGFVGVGLCIGIFLYLLSVARKAVDELDDEDEEGEDVAAGGMVTDADELLMRSSGNREGSASLVGGAAGTRRSRGSSSGWKRSTSSDSAGAGGYGREDDAVGSDEELMLSSSEDDDDEFEEEDELGDRDDEDGFGFGYADGDAGPHARTSGGSSSEWSHRGNPGAAGARAGVGLYVPANSSATLVEGRGGYGGHHHHHTLSSTSSHSSYGARPPNGNGSINGHGHGHSNVNGSAFETPYEARQHTGNPMGISMSMGGMGMKRDDSQVSLADKIAQMEHDAEGYDTKRHKHWAEG